MPEDDNERLSIISKLYAAHMASNQRVNWGYRAAFLMFASFFLSTLFVMFLEWVQPSHNPFAVVGLIFFLSCLAFITGVGAFGAQPTRKE